MRNLFILAAFLLFPALSKAQFKAGQIFFQGGASFSLNDTKYRSFGSDPDSKFGNYGHNLNYSSGYFTADNRAIGWTLGQSLSLTNFGEYGSTIPSPRSLRSIGFSAGRFVEHYKSLSDKFALYIRPGFGLSYLLQNDDGQQQGNIRYTQNQTNTFFLSVNVSGGVAWLVSPKWALYGGFACANPISISAGWNNIATISTNSPRGLASESRGSFFNYNLSPALSSGSINLGFRYLVTRESAY